MLLVYLLYLALQCICYGICVNCLHCSCSWFLLFLPHMWLISNTYLINITFLIGFQNLHQSCSRDLQSRPPSHSTNNYSFCHLFLQLLLFFFYLSKKKILWCFWFSVIKFAIWAIGLLSCGAKFVRLWMCAVLTISCCCISYFSYNIHNPTWDASLGKKVLIVHRDNR